jgi:nucleotide-binding universal stress UspA family protein
VHDQDNPCSIWCRWGNDPVFVAAIWAAHLFGAHIDFLHARTNVVDEATHAAAFVGGAIASAEMIERLDALATKRDEEVLSSYRSFCERERLIPDAPESGGATISTAWHQETGDIAELVTAFGQTSDLLVVRRPVNDALVTRPILEAAIFGTGRPALIPASATPTLDTVAVAWKPTREADCAITAAMPFLTRAERIVVLAAPDQHPVDKASCERLVRTLRRQCPVVDASYVDVSSGHVGAALLAAANKVGAGLFVMGAYGRRRMREVLFGGVTEHVLRHTQVPVLMAH